MELPPGSTQQSLYGEAPPGGPTLTFYTPFSVFREGNTFIYRSYKMVPISTECFYRSPEKSFRNLSAYNRFTIEHFYPSKKTTNRKFNTPKDLCIPLATQHTLVRDILRDPSRVKYLTNSISKTLRTQKKRTLFS